MPEPEPEPAAPAEPDPIVKKIRNLTKKLKAIDGALHLPRIKQELTVLVDLKQRLARGDKLEVTQMQKIDAENEIRKELAALEAQT